MSLGNSVQLFRSAKEASGNVFLVRAQFTSRSGASTLLQLIEQGAGADRITGGGVDERGARGIGDESFGVTISFVVRGIQRVRVVFLYLRVKRVVSTLILSGFGRNVSPADAVPLARAVARRARAAL